MKFKLEFAARCAKCHAVLAAKFDLDARDPVYKPVSLGPIVWVEPCVECLSDAEESGAEEVDR